MPTEKPWAVAGCGLGIFDTVNNRTPPVRRPPLGGRFLIRWRKEEKRGYFA
nr:MAG TPA: hypothetical protein [Caudoviricetes sp.]